MNRRPYRWAVVGVLIVGMSVLPPLVGAVPHLAATPTPTEDVLPTPPPMPKLTEGTGMSDTTATARPTEAATPAADARPDECEPNNARTQACGLAADTVSGPFTFLPAGDQDWYRADLGPANGLTTEISVRGTSGLELLTTISRDDGTPLAAYSSPAISATLAPDIGGPIIIRVENRAPGHLTGQSYTIEVRRALPLAPTPPLPRLHQPTPTPDLGENNWSPQTAAPIGIGVVYDLNLTCPVDWPGACEGGDHDYFAVPVKRGSAYLVCTFDLGPGVDTVLDLYWGDVAQPLASNDDAGPIGAASVLRWVAPTDGTALVRVGPRTGGLRPLVDDPQAGFYRFAVALADSLLAQQLVERLAEQTERPTATPQPLPAGEPGGAAPPLPGGPDGGPGTGSAPAPGPAAPTTPSTLMPTVTRDTTPQPIIAEVVELPPLLTPVPTPLPQVRITVHVRVGYDRNQNKTMDVDEGVRGLAVYVTDPRGQLIGEGRSGLDGTAAITVQVAPQDELTITIPYFAAVQRASAARPAPPPILISGSAQLPALLP